MSTLMATEILRPNAAGDECTIDGQNGAACPDHYANVNNEVPDDGETVKTTSNAYLRDLYNLPPFSGSGIINFIKIYFRLWSFNQSGYAMPALKSNGTVTDGTEINPLATWTTYSQQWNTNPADSQPWEKADIDALQIGISLKNPASSWISCDQVYVEVEFAVDRLILDAYHSMVFQDTNDAVEFQDIEDIKFEDLAI